MPTAWIPQGGETRDARGSPGSGAYIRGVFQLRAGERLAAVQYASGWVPPRGAQDPMVQAAAAQRWSDSFGPRET